MAVPVAPLTTTAPLTTSYAVIDGLRIAHDAGVLTPRPWTAHQGRWAAELAPAVPPGPILEVCSGAGHIGLVAARWSGRPLVQVDADPRACAFARRNAAAAGLADRVEVRCATIEELARRGERFPLIIADPPYIPTVRTAEFPEDPLGAIDGGPDGLALARACVDLFAELLDPRGAALLQLGGPDQVEAMAAHRSDALVLADRRQLAPDRQIARFTPVDTGDRWPLTSWLEALLDGAARPGSRPLSPGAAGERDQLRALLAIHDLWMAPLDRLGDRATFQGHPTVAAVKRELEAALVTRLDTAEGSPAVDDPDPVAAIRRISTLELVPAVYDWLADAATGPELVEFLALEGGPDADFDDLVALTQVGIGGLPKLALAANYWDEMGRGDAEEVHTSLHARLVAALDLPAIPVADLPASALTRKCLGGLLATNRYLQPEAIGAFGLVELQAGPRCRAVLQALERLDAPADARPFYAEHARADPRHGKDWLDRVVAPLAGDPRWAEGIVRGARWRHVVNSAFFGDALARFT